MRLSRASAAPFPDMVKIDAEGFDLKVIAGASTLLGKTDIFILEASICAPDLENTVENVLLTMTRAGYQLIDISAFFNKSIASLGCAIFYSCAPALRCWTDLSFGL